MNKGCDRTKQGTSKRKRASPKREKGVAQTGKGRRPNGKRARSKKFSDPQEILSPNVLDPCLQKQENSDFDFSVEPVVYERGSSDEKVQLGELQTIMVACLDEISVSLCGEEGGYSEDGVNGIFFHRFRNKLEELHA